MRERDSSQWPDDEVTQPMATVAPSEADTVCAAWMQRGRDIAERRDQTAPKAA